MAAALTLTASPARAQTPVADSALRFSWVGAAAPAEVTRLQPSNLIAQPPTWFGPPATNVARNLDIAATNWTATVAIGTAGRCGSDDPGTTGTWIRNPDKVTQLNPEGWEWQRSGTPRPLVRYHIADARYSRGEPIARACTSWVEGRWKPATGGTFTLRIWGQACLALGRSCRSFKDGAGQTLLTSGIVNQNGYLATFSPGPNCGPARWPSPEWQAAGGPPYAEWCDVQVNLN